MTLFSNYFYHQTTLSFLVAFGSLFDGITVQKYDGNGMKIQDYPVPIEYSPKAKWYASITERPDFTSPQVQITLPRMSFEIVDYTYNSDRKLGFNGTYLNGSNNDGSRTKIYSPSPIDLSVNLYCLTKDNVDNFQIQEQILPYFQPFLNLNYTSLPEYNISNDFQVYYNGMTVEDQYTGDVETQRMIMTTYQFKVPVNYYGPTNIGYGVIKDVTVGLGMMNPDEIVETINYAIKPISANQNQPYTIVETLTP